MHHAQVPDLQSVRFKNLSLGYGQAELINSASVDFPSGTVVHVRGPTGSGKSAILKVAAGLLAPMAGEYLINDQPVHDMTFEELLPFRLNIGYGFDMGGLLSNRTLAENLVLPLAYHKRLNADDIQERIDEILYHFKLRDVADRRPSAVAGSQRKACCVARALIMRPQMLILDDPTTGMGVHSVQALANHIEHYMKKGELRFVILTSSDQNFLGMLAMKELEIQNKWLEWVA
jgi:phospholipid/cholesterol/gamma-HCH transport system ATP-binding protein